MEIDAVVPNRNGAGIVGPCVSDALAAGVRHVIVVDDGSVDESAEEAAAAGAHLLIARGRGFSSAVNQGAASSTTESFLILNSDCYLEVDSVASMQAVLDSSPEVAAVGAALVDEHGQPSASHGRVLTLASAVGVAVSIWAPRPPRGRGVTHVSFVPLACVLVRRAAWESVGGLDERYVFYFEDHDLSWRLASAGWKIAVCWDAAAVHLGGGSSTAADPQGWFRQYAESRLRYLKKRYPVGWIAFAAVWVPSALAHAALWRLRGGVDGRRWASAWRRASVAGFRD